MPSERMLPRLFLILLVAVLALAGWQWRHGAPLSANLMVAVALMYYVMPDVEQKFRFITPGSVLAVVVWIIASLGFAFYVKKIGRAHV